MHEHYTGISSLNIVILLPYLSRGEQKLSFNYNEFNGIGYAAF